MLSPEEKVARFIYQKSDWNKQPVPKPKPKVFLPMIEEGVLETSVCRISAISEQRIWEIANKTRYPLPALARADISVQSINSSGLKVEAAPNEEMDYPEHAVIIGWPE
jgi:hypothetical protein